MDRVFVGSALRPEGERFCIVRARAEQCFPRGTVTSISAAIEDYMRHVRWLTEEEVRRDLEAASLLPSDIDHQIVRARALRQSGPEIVLEHVTAIGHRTVHGQVVMRKTERPGARAFERIYVLRCEHCGCEHECGGGDIHRRRCSSCDVSVD